MGTWSIDATTEPGILRLKVSGALTVEEVTAFVKAHNLAVDRYKGCEYREWCDIAELATLRQEVADVLETAKRYSNQQPNFRGSAVLASSATVAMQHRRTSITGGVSDTELISDDPAALRAHLRDVKRGGVTRRIT
jgi:hypothetical protein